MANRVLNELVTIFYLRNILAEDTSICEISLKHISEIRRAYDPLFQYSLRCPRDEPGWIVDIAFTGQTGWRRIGPIIQQSGWCECTVLQFNILHKAERLIQQHAVEMFAKMEQVFRMLDQILSRDPLKYRTPSVRERRVALSQAKVQSWKHSLEMSSPLLPMSKASSLVWYKLVRPKSKWRWDWNRIFKTSTKSSESKTIMKTSIERARIWNF